MQMKCIGTGFLVFVYEANRPIGGFPNKILRSAPIDQKKLKIFENNESFTQKLLQRFEQFNLNNRRYLPLISNWSDRDTINPAPISPWWWPVWSDKLKINEPETFSKNNLSTLLTNNKESIASSFKTIDKKSLNPMEEIKISKWKWPF